MLDYKDIITKHCALGMTGSAIAETLGVSKSGVNDFLRAFKACKDLKYPLPKGITNYGIAAVVYPRKPTTHVGRDVSYELPDYEAVSKDMSSRKNMTLVVLWNRYAKKCRDCGLKFYSYRQFCENYAKWCEENKESLHFNAVIGQKMEVDFAGKTFRMVDPLTGETMEIVVFVAVLPYSQYIYAEGMVSTKEPQWIAVNNNALAYFGGVPALVVCDNCKQAVIANRDWIAPELNKDYAEWAEHNHTVMRCFQHPPVLYTATTVAQQKSLTRFRDSLIRQRSRHLVELTNILDKVFPEFKPFFKGRFSATALYILSHYASPEKISNMNSKSYEPLRRLSRGRFSMVDFIELKTLARNTVGSTFDYLLQEMEITIDIYDQLQSKVEEIELQINDCVLGLAPPMLTIPGIGVASAAVILSEFGDLSKFNSPSKLLSFAGLEPGYFQSGTSENSGKIVKHGSSHLRYAIMNCAQTVVNNEPTFAAYYAKKRAEGKEHRVALTHVAKKLLRVIYSLQTKELSYNPDLVR